MTWREERILDHQAELRIRERFKHENDARIRELKAILEQVHGVPASPSGCQPSASAVPSSQSGIPNAIRHWGDGSTPCYVEYNGPVWTTPCPTCGEPNPTPEIVARCSVCNPKTEASNG